MILWTLLTILVTKSEVIGYVVLGSKRRLVDAGGIGSDWFVRIGDGGYWSVAYCHLGQAFQLLTDGSEPLFQLGVYKSIEVMFN